LYIFHKIGQQSGYIHEVIGDFNAMQVFVIAFATLVVVAIVDPENRTTV